MTNDGHWLPPGTIPEPGRYWCWIEGKSKGTPFIREVGRPSFIGRNIRIYSERLPDPPEPPIKEADHD